MTESSAFQVFSFLLLLSTCAGFEGESACENTCTSRGGVSLLRRCHCDSTCAVVYNDCCYDSPYKLTRPPDNIPEWRCRFVPGENRYFFMIDKCQDGWDGDRIVIQNCQNLSSDVINDPEGQVPVTSRTTEITYKNHYCAVCNDDMDDVVSWQIKAQCDDDDVTSEDVQNNLKFNKIRQKWGLYKKDALSRRSVFYECQIIYHRPIDVSKESVRECAPGLISSCPPSWKDLTIKRKCESYVNPVFWTHQESYRNIHCAVCNYQNRDDYSCELGASVRPNEMSRRNEMSSLVILFKGDNGRGCGSNEFFVPKTKSCCKCNEVFDCKTESCCKCNEFLDCKKKSCVKCNGVFDPTTESCREILS